MALQLEYNHSVRPKLDLVDELHRILGRDRDVPLPQIAVVGTQSSGKSSVLERLSKMPVPRAHGLCTRVPLILAMKGTPQKRSIRIAYQTKAGHTVEKELKESDVEQAIVQATNAIAGDNKGITDGTIKLSIAGPGLPDLTLIDLPGITYNPVGDQPEDIDRQVKDLIRGLIEAKETIILCVFAGDVDLQASEALKLAREVDPQGDRTLGVITKIDRMQSHVGLREAILQTGMSAINIKLGMIAVRNRSTSELADASGVEGADETERKTFDSIACLQNLPAGHLGISALASRLCNLQSENLQKALPQVKQNLLKQMLSTEEQLSKLPRCLNATESFALFQNIVEDLKRMFFHLHHSQYEVLDGQELSEDSEHALHIRPRIEAVLQGYGASLKHATKSPFANEAGNDIKRNIQESSGRSLPNMMADVAFRTLVRQWHRPFHDITKQALQDAIACVSDYVERCVTMVIRSAVGLQPLLQDAVSEALEAQFEKAEADILRMLEKEQVVVYTLNNYYVTTLTCVRDNVALAASGQRAEKEQAQQALKAKLGLDASGLSALIQLHSSHDTMAHQILDMQLSMFCYNKVVRKRLLDGLMQVVHLDFLDYVAFKLGSTLGSITKEQTHDALRVSLAVEQERITLEQRVSAYSAALKRVGGEPGALARERRVEQRLKRQRSHFGESGGLKKLAVSSGTQDHSLSDNVAGVEVAAVSCGSAGEGLATSAGKSEATRASPSKPSSIFSATNALPSNSNPFWNGSATAAALLQHLGRSADNNAPPSGV